MKERIDGDGLVVELSSTLLDCPFESRDERRTHGLAQIQFWRIHTHSTTGQKWEETYKTWWEVWQGFGTKIDLLTGMSGTYLTNKWSDFGLTEIARLNQRFKFLWIMDLEGPPFLHPRYDVLTTVYFHITQKKMKFIGKGEPHMIQTGGAR